MKKVIFLLMFAGTLAACKKDPVGETATKALAGEWYVIVDGVDADGNVTYGNLLGGRGHLITYNTAANNPSEMFVDDLGNQIWNFKARIKSDVNALTFSTDGSVKNEYANTGKDDDGKAYTIDVTIEDGKVIPAGTINPHDTRADSIVFYAKFSNDKDMLAGAWAKLRISGYRYTGFATDN